jgi:predicted nucleic acid-binding Zn ribbon protein
MIITDTNSHPAIGQCNTGYGIADFVGNTLSIADNSVYISKNIQRRREHINAEREAMPDNICEYCGKEFRPIRKSTKYCSYASGRERKRRRDKMGHSYHIIMIVILVLFAVVVWFINRRLTWKL